MAADIMGLFASGGPFTAREIGELLRVKPGSVRFMLHLLDEANLVCRDASGRYENSVASWSRKLSGAQDGNEIDDGNAIEGGHRGRQQHSEQGIQGD